ncbi:hypothetical protein [Campylobacter sp. MG1]|uniref:hypothetical protein n=1 Tax=Campylobacter sp. MG1 TaxID=2976332 RepID=UPI00226CEB98|nr:hypothetical protein [Campylobacter sp. MG1]
MKFKTLFFAIVLGGVFLTACGTMSSYTQSIDEKKMERIYLSAYADCGNGVSQKDLEEKINTSFRVSNIIGRELKIKCFDYKLDYDGRMMSLEVGVKLIDSSNNEIGSFKAISKLSGVIVTDTMLNNIAATRIFNYVKINYIK